MPDNTSIPPCACGQACTLYTVRDVAKLLRLHTRSVWRMSALAEAGQNDFPKPLRLGPKTIRWRASAVMTYLDGLTGKEKQP